MWKKKLDEWLTRVLVVGCAVAYAVGFVLILIGNLLD